MPPDGVSYIDLVAEPKLTALGFITLKTKMKKTIKCNCLSGDFCPGQLKSNSTAPDSLFLHDEDYYTVEGGPDFNFTATGENVTYTPLQNYSADDVFAPVGVYC